MSEQLELTIEVDNIEEFKAALNKFGVMFKNEMYSGFQRIANKEEKKLKSTGGFKDRTGHLRRSLFATATYNPLGLEMGSMSKYAIYVAEGHGTWKGNWWNTYLRGMVPRVVEGVTYLLQRLVNKFNREVR
jgi:hypothetical protein